MHRCGRAANVAVVIVLNGGDSLSPVGQNPIETGPSRFATSAVCIWRGQFWATAPLICKSHTLRCIETRLALSSCPKLC
jgi:hypothetical protein